MARISELHYSNAYASSSGTAEFLEVALGPSDDPADFTVSFYQSNGSLGIEVVLSDPNVQTSVDAENGEFIYIISADDFPILLTDPDGSGSTNYEAYALTNTATGTVIDFYDIGGGTTNITAIGGAANGAVSQNLPVLVGPQSTTTTLQFNQPNPDTLVYETVGAGDTGPACFVAGTRLATPDGPVPIESLQPGDLVDTLDGDPQRVCWVGMRRAAGTGSDAPIRFRSGSFGAMRDVLVSPNHRILVSGWQAELLFGVTELLVPAKRLVNDATILRHPIEGVCYVHLLFASHQIVCADGLLSESLLPNRLGLEAWGDEARTTILNRFPELGHSDGAWKPARRLAQDRSAQLLIDA